MKAIAELTGTFASVSVGLFGVGVHPSSPSGTVPNYSEPFGVGFYYVEIGLFSIFFGASAFFLVSCDTDPPTLDVLLESEALILCY